MFAFSKERALPSKSVGKRNPAYLETKTAKTNTYIGITANQLKKRYGNHLKSFKHKMNHTDSERSKHVWNFKEKNWNKNFMEDYRLRQTIWFCLKDLQLVHDQEALFVKKPSNLETLKPWTQMMNLDLIADTRKNSSTQI